jgi:hypothetical protein
MYAPSAARVVCGRDAHCRQRMDGTRLVAKPSTPKNNPAIHADPGRASAAVGNPVTGAVPNLDVGVIR